MPDSARVCAVVIAYHPSLEPFTACLKALSLQVDQILVVDNSEKQEYQAEVSRITELIRMGETHKSILLIQNRANIGLARALNQGVSWAASRGFDFVLLLDQDSVPANGTVKALLGAYHTQGTPPDRTVVSATNVERSQSRLLLLLNQIFYGRASTTGRPRLCRLAMTSGMLLAVKVVQLVGPFDEKLFLDGCDHDFCLRHRHRGGVIVTVPNAIVEHSLGGPHGLHIPRLGVTLRYENPNRIYYLTRDPLRVAGRYIAFDPICSILISSIVFGRVVLLILGWPGSQRQLDTALSGLRDLLAHRAGQRAYDH